MKKLLLIPLVILFVSTGCKKEPVIISAPPPVLPQPGQAFAGSDQWVPLPANFSVVYGGTSHAEATIESYFWKNISGPSSYVLVYPREKHAVVTNLEKGTYEFEFTVTTKAGSPDKDTVSIHVYEPRTAGANEFIFKNLKWMCPFRCAVYIENFNLYVPNGTAFKVFLKSAHSANWIELLNNTADKYLYGINNNHLAIDSFDPDDEDLPVDVKITF